MLNSLLLALSVCAVLGVSTRALAQKLPPPSRTVFKCEVNGKTVYSDAPCLGATRVDVESTRGMNKHSGRERIGADVRRERQREQFAEAVKPITGMDAKQLAIYQRRMKLAPQAQRECGKLDKDVSVAEAVEVQSSERTLPEVQRRLFGLRKRQAELGC